MDELMPRWKRAHDGLTRLCLVAECTSVFVEQKLTSEQLLLESKRLALSVVKGSADEKRFLEPAEGCLVVVR